jgi:hypothetical protein
MPISYARAEIFTGADRVPIVSHPRTKRFSSGARFHINLNCGRAT